MEIKALFNKNKGSETSPQPQNKKRIKRLRKWIILGAAVLVIAGIIANCSLQTKKLASMVAFSETAILKKTDLISSIGGTGTVESNRSLMVYSTQAYPVKAVHVKVGDYVEAGELLCELDASALINQIETQELTTGVSAKAALAQVKSASDNYILAKELLDEGLNTAVLAAENNVRATYDAWQKAQRMYSTALNSSDNPNLAAADAAYTSALSAFEAAQTNLNNAEQTYSLAEANFKVMPPPANNSANILLAEGALVAAQAALQEALNETTMDPNKVLQARSVLEAAEHNLLIEKQKALGPDEYQAALAAYNASSSAKNAAQAALANAQSALNSAKAQREAAYLNSDSQLKEYAYAKDSAYSNYRAALVSLESAEKSAKAQLKSSKNALNSARANANTDAALLRLAQLQEDLENTRIKAEEGGTVTAVYAKVGASGAGLLFVIEDVSDLRVESAVSGYDIGALKPGMAVTIKSDATGDALIKGSLSRIAPTSQKNALGQSNPTGDVLFSTEVKVADANSGLLIGMNARLKYIIEERKDVLAVPFDALFEKENGENYILVLSEQKNGKYKIDELLVNTGLESDLMVEVYGEGVREGLRLLNNPSEFRHLIGSELMLVEDSPALDSIRSIRPFAAMRQG